MDLAPICPLFVIFCLVCFFRDFSRLFVYFILHRFASVCFVLPRFASFYYVLPCFILFASGFLLTG